MSTWAIVPMRGLASGKSRLAAVLSVDERRALNVRLLVRVLDAIAQSEDAPASSEDAPASSGNALAPPRNALALPRNALAPPWNALAPPWNALAPPWNALARCIVVSPDPEALALARTRGAQPLEENSDGGLNAALELARAEALARGAATLLILAADLPLVDAVALGQLRRAIPATAAAVISDKDRTGTNGLLLPASADIRFAFGADSLERHRRALEALRIDTRIWHDPALAFDLDTAADYAAWKSTHAAGS